uniref:Uncharacterized protein n=1 Tax=Cannabis sativa TaxID=3483 RepID=A0A803QME5_CANSA
MKEISTSVSGPLIKDLRVSSLLHNMVYPDLKQTTKVVQRPHGLIIRSQGVVREYITSLVLPPRRHNLLNLRRTVRPDLGLLISTNHRLPNHRFLNLVGPWLSKISRLYDLLNKLDLL